MKVTKYKIETHSDIVILKYDNETHSITKNRCGDNPMSITDALGYRNVRVSVINENGKVIVVNPALQRFLESQGYNVPDDIIIHSVGGVKQQ